MKTLQRVLILLVVLTAAVTTAAAQDGATHYVRFEHNGAASYGLLDGEMVRELHGDDLFGALPPTGRTFPLSEVRLLVPIDPAQVQKVLGIAINTRRPSRMDPVTHPLYFANIPTSLRGQ